MTNKTYLLIDTNNMLHRMKNLTQGDVWTKTGLSMHVLLTSIRKSWRDMNADHVVFFLEGRSWRKAAVPTYKADRKLKYAARSVEEQEADNYFNECMNDLIDWLHKRSNCTVIQNKIVEADDLIARWVQTHPDDYNIIISSDSDFVQCVGKNCALYNGVQNVLIEPHQITDEKGRSLPFSVKSNSKIKIGKHNDDPIPIEDDWIEWALFLKCIRGDSGDNVFSACPKANIKKIRAAFDDRHNRGYDWHNFMKQKWTDHNGVEKTVETAYQENRMLIDLTQQPDDIVAVLDESIREATREPKSNLQIGAHLLKLCGKYELTKIKDFPRDYIEFLSAGYPHAD